MILRIVLMLCGVLTSASLFSSRALSMQESLQTSLEAAEVFRTLEQAGGSSGQRSDDLKTVFACMHALAHRVSCTERFVLTRLELAELLVELAESVESADLRNSSELAGDQESQDDDMPSAEEQLGQTLLQQLYAEPNHQERVSLVEKILAASDKVEWFFCALFNKVSSVVAGTVSAVQQSLAGTLNGAAQLLGYSSTQDAFETISDATNTVFDALENTTIQVLQSAQNITSQVVITAEEQVQDIAIQSLNLTEAGINCVSTQLQAAVMAMPGAVQSLENEASSVLQVIKEDAQDLCNSIEEELQDASYDDAVSYDEENRSELADDFLAEEYSENSFLESGDYIVAPLTAQEALLIRAVLNFDQQEILARSVLVAPDYSTPVNIELAPFVNSLCHQVNRSGLQDQMGKYVQYLCHSISDNECEEKLHKLLSDKNQSEEVCKEVVATAGALVIDQALVSLSSLKSALQTITLALR